MALVERRAERWAKQPRQGFPRLNAARLELQVLDSLADRQALAELRGRVKKLEELMNMAMTERQDTAPSWSRIRLLT